MESQNDNDKEIKGKNKIPFIVHFEIPADDVERARGFIQHCLVGE